jgi:hypothetical protein
VITAGQVGNVQAPLGASGFDVVAVAETADALVDAVSVDEPDAIVVEADLCDSLEHVRDLAPDAVLIVVGDHTPFGAVGRIESGVSGTVMSGLLHALVAEGVGAAAPWGLVPAFGPSAAAQIPQSVLGSLLSAKADFVRAFLVNALHALRHHAELVTAASTVAVTVSAGVLLTVSELRSDERPARVPVPAPAAERAPQERPPQHPVFAVSPTTPMSIPDPSRSESERSDQREPNRSDSKDHRRHDGPGENAHDPHGQNDDPHGQNDDPHGKNDDPHGKNDDSHGKKNDPHGQNNDPHGQNENTHGDEPHSQNENTHGKNEGNDDHGVNQDKDDQGRNEDSDTDEGDGQDENEETETEVADNDLDEYESQGDPDEVNDD